MKNSRPTRRKDDGVKADSVSMFPSLQLRTENGLKNSEVMVTAGANQVNFGFAIDAFVAWLRYHVINNQRTPFLIQWRLPAFVLAKLNGLRFSRSGCLRHSISCLFLAVPAQPRLVCSSICSTTVWVGQTKTLLIDDLVLIYGHPPVVISPINSTC